MIIQIVSALLIIQDIWSACLSTTELKSLNFTDVSSEPKTYSDAAYCKTLFNNHGGCVTEEEVKKRIEDSVKNMINHVNAGGGFSDVFKDLYTSLKDKVSDEKATVQAQQIEDITKAADTNKYKCIMSLEYLIHGTTCFISSGNAST